MLKSAGYVGGLIAAFAAGGLASRYFWQPESGTAPRQNGGDVARPADLPPTVMALGRILPGDGVIEVGGPPGDRVATVLVSEGAAVGKDDELLRLDSFALRKAERDLAAAQLAEAEELVKRELEHADRLVAEAKLAAPSPELEQLDFDAQTARIELLEANLSLTQDDLRRLEELRSKDAALVAAQALAHQQLLVKQAEAELRAGEKLLAKARVASRHAAMQAEARLRSLAASRERIPAAAQLEALRKGLALAEARLELAIVRAPNDGQAVKVYAQPGESIGPGPLVLLTATAPMTVLAEVYEDHALRIRPGQKATVRSKALPAALTGQVERVGALVAGNAMRSLNPAASSEQRVVEAVIRLDAESAPLAARLLQLQVDVSIQVDEQASRDAGALSAADGQPAPDKTP